ncbi:MAG: 4Fe-4S binding protein [Dehalococcoidia bacterium]
MAEKDIYEQLAAMIDEEDTVGMPATPAFLKLLRIQYTPEEAELSLKIRLSGGTLEDLAERTGLEKNKLRDKLLEMADKGIIIYDPVEEDPVYRAVGMTAGGLTETGAWGGVRFPYSVELIKTMHEVGKDHSEGALAKLGFAYTPVWAGMAALPDDIKPEENLAEAVRDAGHWSVSLCPCRVTREMVTPGDPCQHMMETCVHTGALSRWAVKHHMARELTYDELVELLKEVNRDGLVHTINIFGLICNCCNDCCPIFHTYSMGAPTFIPSPFVARAEAGLCIACGTCEERCPVNAITVDAFAIVDSEKCLGCGVCVPTCSEEAMCLVRRPEA